MLLKLGVLRVYPTDEEHVQAKGKYQYFLSLRIKAKKMCITLADPDLEIRGRGVGVALKIFLTLSHFFWHVRHCGDRLWSKILRGPSPGSTTA